MIDVRAVSSARVSASETSADGVRGRSPRLAMETVQEAPALSRASASEPGALGHGGGAPGGEPK